MARKKKEEFNFFDTEYFGGGNALGAIIDADSPAAPSEKEVEIVKNTAGDYRDIPVDQLVDYNNHTFSVLDNEDMAILVDSIKDVGIILPLLVRNLSSNKYEIISGHRRCFAAKKIGLETVPCKVIDVDDDMADILMADTNIAREIILPSEKAKTYKVRYEAAVRQGKRKRDEISDIADKASDSVSSIRRYIKLASLRPSLLRMVDNNIIPVIAGVNLTALSEKHQDIVAEVLSEQQTTLTLKMSEDLKTQAARGLTKETAESIIFGKKKVRKTKPPVKKTSSNIFKNVASEDKDYLIAYSEKYKMSMDEVIAKCVDLLKKFEG